MKISRKTKSILELPIILLLTLVIIIACDKAKEAVDDTANKVVEKTGEVVSETAEKLNKTAEESVNKLTEKIENIIDDNFLVGTWRGKFDGRKTILIVTNQDGNNFNGKITINYRDVINQEVKGVIDPETNNITMKDQLHSRYSGRYAGKLSDDRTVYSGVFTMKVDGKKFKFNLKKK